MGRPSPSGCSTYPPVTQVEIPKGDLGPNQLVFRLASARTVGFQGALQPWLDLAPAKLLLDSAGAAVRAGSVSLLFTFSVDATMLNSFELQFRFNRTLGYFSTDERRCAVLIQDRSHPCSAQFDPLAQNQTFRVKRATVPHVAEGSLVLNLTVGLENEAIPSGLTFAFELLSESGRPLFQQAWAGLSTGCPEGCGVCNSSSLQACLKCLPDFDTSNETGCEQRVPRVPYFELLRRINAVSRTTTVSVVLAGVALACLLHLFTAKTSGGEVSAHTVDKICISNVTSLALLTVFVQDLLETDGDHEAVLTQWAVRLFVSFSFVANCAALCVYHSLTRDLAFATLRNKRWPVQTRFSLAVLLLGFPNLLQCAANLRVLARLQSAGLASPAEKPAAARRSPAGAPLRLSRVPEEAEQQAGAQPRRRSNSDNVDAAPQAVEARSVRSSEDRLLKDCGGDKAPDAESAARPQASQPEFGLLDFLEFLARLNLGLKVCLLVACLLIATTCAARFWSWDRPCELYGLLLCEAGVYLVPLRRTEPSWQASRNEEKARLLLESAQKQLPAPQLRDEEAGRRPLVESGSGFGHPRPGPAPIERATAPVDQRSLYDLILDSMLQKSKQTLDDLVNESASDSDSFAEEFERYVEQTGGGKVGPKTQFYYFQDKLKRAEEFPPRNAAHCSDDDSDFEYGPEQSAAFTDPTPSEELSDQADFPPNQSSQQP